MLDEWSKVFHIKSEVRFGPIIDNNGINLFYDEDSNIKEIINNLRSVIETENDYRSIMIAGHAGVGKTTLLHYIKSRLDSQKYDLFIINNKENNTEFGIIEDINRKFKFFYRELFLKVEKTDSKIDKEIKKILDNMFADIEYQNIFEKYRLYLYTYEKLCDDIVIYNSGVVKKLRIALDQIDLLDSNQMLKILHTNFTPIIHARYIIATICARFETLDSAKKSVDNFFCNKF